MTSDTGPNVFALPPGVDFAAELLAGLRQRFDGGPAALADVLLIVNTGRMARRLQALLAEGLPTLGPRIALVSSLPPHPATLDVPPPVPPLRRRLELATLIARLLDREPDLAPRQSLFDLADGLAALMEEMHGEGVAPEAIENLDVTDESGHWERALRFVRIVRDYLESGAEPDAEEHRRMTVERLVAHWQARPPEHPIVLAGSTGSRGTTQALMAAIARLPRGAVVLPGFDFDMPASVWERLDDALHCEDHPQFRFRRLMTALDIAPEEISRWTEAAPACPGRNALVSLALRPAPVTDQWLAEGPRLVRADEAMRSVTILEADTEREEALAIALRLRCAVEEGWQAAVVTQDRTLTRRVASALDRWGIVPDDSAGTGLHLTPPGRFLRHVAALFSHRLDSRRLIELLKHPLAHSGEGRARHLRHTRELEMFFRKKGIAYPDRRTLDAFAKKARPERAAWCNWVAETLLGREIPDTLPFGEWLERHVALAEAIAGGSGAEGSGQLWEEAAGKAAAAEIAAMRSAAEAGGEMSAIDYESLFTGALTRGESIRDPAIPHPLVRFYGRLEARVQDAELVILAGLNEGTWPEMPPPDPWLNRRMRHEAGLLVPERQIGLAAHDFQLAVAAPEVWLTRATRTEDAETVPSRWLLRLANLLDGLEETGGRAALKAARDRARKWLSWARELERTDPAKRAPRPSPAPPVEARPRRLSVTQIATLRRDPYAIYGSKVLRLEPLSDLTSAPDARLKGVVVHGILERFVKATCSGDAELSTEELMRFADEELAANVPWASARLFWRTWLAGIADWFVKTEAQRQAEARPTAFEAWGEMRLTQPEFTLVAKADRIDLDHEGKAVVWDYKTGQVPGTKAQLHFDRQLLLEAMMVEAGAFEKIGQREVARAAFIGLGRPPTIVDAPLDKEPLSETRQKFVRLLLATLRRDHGFTSRRAVQNTRFAGDFDHLARYGEWSEADEPCTQVLK